MTTYGIYELKPTPSGDDYRYIQAFTEKESAQKVLDVLKSVDRTNFHTYKIVELEVK